MPYSSPPFFELIFPQITIATPAIRISAKKPTIGAVFSRKLNEIAILLTMKEKFWLMVGLNKGDPPAMYPDYSVTKEKKLTFW